jgi:hypothetical protein
MEVVREADLTWRSQPEFAGSQACRKCHADQYESHLETAHSRALQEVVPESEPPDATFDDPLAGRRYRVAHVDGQLVHEVSLLLPGGESQLQTRFPMRYRIGSGHFGRGYLAATDGFLVESPISWFETTEKWGVSPGFENPRSVPFGRTIPEGCLICHSGRVDRSTISDLRMRIVEAGVGCERCHGPGKAHVERETAGANDGASGRAIVNPRRLPRKQAEAVCHQCHRQGDIGVAARGARPAGFVPGEVVESYRHDYLLRTPRKAMQVVGHVGQLSRSACYRQSETLTCVTCHAPHLSIAPEDRADHYRSVCLTCHAESACRVALPQRLEQQNDCTACHMPRLDTDIPHAAFTHHQIGRHPLPAEPVVTGGAERLVALFDLEALSEGDRQRSQGLALRELLQTDKVSALSVVERQEIAARAEKLLTELPQESVDAAVERALAIIYRLQGRVHLAEAAAHRALLQADLNSSEKIGALNIIAGICMRQDRLSEAVAYFTELTRLRRSADDWNCLGACQADLNNSADAVRTLEMSRTIDPDSLTPCQMLVGLYRSRGDIAAEQRMLVEVERLKGRGKIAR